MIPFKKILFTSILLFSIINLSYSQTTLKGVVLDQNSGEALIGANVLIKGTTVGTVTDWDGTFELITNADIPVDLSFSYIGYVTQDMTITDATQEISMSLAEESITIAAVEVRGQRISDKQKESALTVEALDLIAIKETPSASFYEGLGSLKGVDLTTASLGFTIINTRGFNSTSPVRSLQIIDGVDNQSPGLNFSLGNFLGAPELDVLKVELIQGASSAFFGPNAFNGVIDIRTKDPFFQKGLAASLKYGERNLFETAVRYADVIKNKDGQDKFAYKLNLAFMRANDWEAENYDPVYETTQSVDNPGGYDAVNVYGDEDFINGSGVFGIIDRPGLGNVHRTGYQERDLVDYNTKNLKANLGLYYKIKEDLVLSTGFNFGSGTTVYQGDNRFSLKNILFGQAKIELKKPNDFFVRAYMTTEDAGDSYDAYFTALRLQDHQGAMREWSNSYANYWTSQVNPRVKAMEGYPDDFPPDIGAIQNFLLTISDSLNAWHDEARTFTDDGNFFTLNRSYLAAGTTEFDSAFAAITSAYPSDDANPGTRLYDKSDLYHVHGEKQIDFDFSKITVGANGRLYTPDTRGTIFIDTSGRQISNWEFGIYGGIEQRVLEDKMKINATVRFDKNQNFKPVVSPAASIVYTPNQNNLLRFTFSSAVRNPTLADQYLNYNVGRATLRGNIAGFNEVYSPENFIDFLVSRDPAVLDPFDEDAIQPEKVRTGEIGYRGSIFDRVWLDAGAYFSSYRDFIGYKIVVDEVEYNPFTNLLTNSKVLRIASNAENTVTTQGVSIGLNYYFPKYLVLAGNYSWNKLNKKGTDDPIIPAYNTPEHKYNLSFSGRDIPVRIGSKVHRNLGFSINYKWIEGFLFEGSPQFTGLIPTYDLLDAQVNWKFRKAHTTLKVGASNVLNKKQFQTYGGPRVGRLAYVSLVYDWLKKD